MARTRLLSARAPSGLFWYASLLYPGFERGDGCGFVERGAVHLGCDRVAREELGRDAGEHEDARRVRRQPRLLAAERKYHGHAVVDVGNCLVCFGREDGEVDR